MKNLLYLGIIAAACAACHGKTQKTTVDSVVTDTTAKDSNAVIVRQFKPIINGTWLVRDYVDAVTHNHSPLLSWPKLEGYSELNIQLSDTAKNFSQASAGLNHHEGTGFKIFLQHGHASNFLKTDLGHLDIDLKGGYYEIGYQLDGADTGLLVYKYSKDRQLMGHKIYTRIPAQQGDAVNWFLNKTILAGNYINTDSLARNTEVSFGANGKVSGLGSYKTYTINADFTGPENDIDQLYFDMDKPGKHPPFTFSFIRDTLSIYTVSHSTDSVSISAGALKYKLVRKH